MLEKGKGFREVDSKSVKVNPFEFIEGYYEVFNTCGQLISTGGKLPNSDFKLHEIHLKDNENSTIGGMIAKFSNLDYAVPIVKIYNDEIHKCCTDLIRKEDCKDFAIMEFCDDCSPSTGSVVYTLTSSEDLSGFLDMED